MELEQKQTGAQAQAWSLQTLHLCESMNCCSVLVPLIPPHTLFSLVCALWLRTLLTSS